MQSAVDVTSNVPAIGTSANQCRAQAWSMPAPRAARSEPKAESIDDAEHDARIVTPVVGPLISK